MRRGRGKTRKEEMAECSINAVILIEVSQDACGASVELEVARDLKFQGDACLLVCIQLQPATEHSQQCLRVHK
jgi:hypothetical protein